MIDSQSNLLSKTGFYSGIGGVHTARTMMLEDLKMLLGYVRNPEAEKAEYIKAIVEDNCLNKRSHQTRKLSANHLVSLYILDPSVTIFRAFRFFWARDSHSIPLIALLCTYCRDGILRMCSPFVFELHQGQCITREYTENFIKNKVGNRFSPATLKSVAQNINSTFTKSGHFEGRIKKCRQRAQASAGSVAFVLLLGYLTGARGLSLFETEYVKLLDCSTDEAIDLAEKASQRGWVTFKRVGDIIEVLFPRLLNEKELEWVREQS